MRLTKFRLRGSLVLMLATAMLSVLVSGALEYWEMERLDRAIAGSHHGDGALALAAQDMRDDVLELRRYEKDIFMNIGDATLVRQYRVKWDRAFTSLRYDLVRARRAGPTVKDAQVQQVTEQIAAYRMRFDQLYAAIDAQTIRTTQQANDAMGPYKESVRGAEKTLAGMGAAARERGPWLNPAVMAERLGLGVSLLLFLSLSVLLVGCLRRAPTLRYA